MIGFEPHHLSIAVVDAGARRERVFSIVELVDILETIPGDGEPGETIAHAHPRRRATNPLLAPAIGDPLGKPERVFLRTFEEIDELTERIAAHLFGTPAATVTARPRRRYSTPPFSASGTVRTRIFRSSHNEKFSM